MAKNETSDETKTRIMQQSRDRRGMVYDLKANGHRLRLSVFAASQSTEAGEWSVQARTGTADDPTIMTEWGPTRADALRSVGVAWTAQCAAQSLPKFDWDAVTEVLVAVRAV